MKALLQEPPLRTMLLQAGLNLKSAGTQSHHAHSEHEAPEPCTAQDGAVKPE